MLEKYAVLIKVKLIKFNIPRKDYSDFEQELKMEVYKAIKTYNENYGKSFCRFIELVIERKILRLLKNSKRSIPSSYGLEETLDTKSKHSVLDTMIYEERIKKIKDTSLDHVKKSILEEVIIEGESIKEYADKHKMTVKEIYNHIYSLRLKFKRDD